MKLTIELGGRKVKMRLPESYAERYDIIAAGANPGRCFAACLGLCWADRKRPKAKYERYNFNALAYGGAVLDELMSRGIPYLEIIQAGGEVYSAIHATIVTADEVDQAEDFTDPKEG